MDDVDRWENEGGAVRQLGAWLALLVVWAGIVAEVAHIVAVAA